MAQRRQAARDCASLAAAHAERCESCSAQAGFGRRGARGDVPFTSLPAFCRVQASLTPTADSDIRIEVWLPARRLERQAAGGRRSRAGWRDHATGARCRGRGRLRAAQHRHRACRRRARVRTRTSREARRRRLSRGPRDDRSGPRRIIDASTAAAPIAYWNGCSFGGRQGLTEAQRFPADYDGIVVGDVANDVTASTPHGWRWRRRSHRTAANEIPPGQYRVIHDAVLAACDALDGVADGVLENPAQCRFDPKSSNASTAMRRRRCLTPEQVETARDALRAVRIRGPARCCSTG